MNFYFRCERFVIRKITTDRYKKTQKSSILNFRERLKKSLRNWLKSLKRKRSLIFYRHFDTRCDIFRDYAYIIFWINFLNKAYFPTDKYIIEITLKFSDLSIHDKYYILMRYRYLLHIKQLILLITEFLITRSHSMVNRKFCLIGVFSVHVDCL